jgi:O-antigen/teichoic acid export membrane protein
MAASFIIQIPLLFIHALRPMLPDIWINGNGCILMMVISSTVITALAYVLWYFFRLEQSDEIWPLHALLCFTVCFSMSGLWTIWAS